MKTGPYRLKQLLVTPTRIVKETKTMIDVICNNEPQNIVSSTVIPGGLSDHELVGFARKLHNIKHQPKVTICRSYSNYVPSQFCEDLQSANFKHAFTSTCVNKAWQNIKEILHHYVNKHAPLVSKNVKGRLSPWITKDVKSEMNLRDRLLSKKHAGITLRLIGSLINVNETG